MEKNMTSLKTGIVILNYNTSEETKKCVYSIRKFEKQYTIYIVDNCSSDHSWDDLYHTFHNDHDIVLLRASRNGGYSYGNNIGITKCLEDNCDIIYIVNSDIELLNSTFTIMTKTLINNPHCMIIGPSVVDNHGNEVQLAKKKLTLRNFIYGRHPFCNISFFKKKVDRLYDIPVNQRFFIFQGMASGCCFGIRATDFKQIHYFDENVFLYYEEDILICKLASHERKAIIDHDAKVWHKESVSTKKSGFAFIRYHRWNSVTYYLYEYLQLNFFIRTLIFIWNTVTWLLLSIRSRTYRELLHDFIKKQTKLLFKRYDTSIKK